MKLIDTHTHVNFPEFIQDAPEVIERALEAGIGMINIGTDLENSEKAAALAENFDNVWASCGVHPNDFSKGFDYDAFKALAHDENIVAIGETGLDFYRTKDKDFQRQQKEFFLEHIKLAKEIKKPLIVHCRDAYSEAYEVLKDEASKLKGIVVHSFTGTWEEAEKFIELGIYLSFNGILTFTHDYDKMVAKAPMESVLLETDAPFLAPEPYRGRRNEPLFVQFAAQQLAKIKKLEIDEVAQTTTNNAIKLFDL
jgi:TatD DNase family protein